VCGSSNVKLADYDVTVAFDRCKYRVLFLVLNNPIILLVPI